MWVRGRVAFVARATVGVATSSVGRAAEADVVAGGIHLMWVRGRVGCV